MSAPKRHYKCRVLRCTNEHRSLHRLPPSEPLRTLWLDFIFDRYIFILKKESTPRLRAQTPAPDKLSTSYFVFQIAFLKELLGTL